MDLPGLRYRSLASRCRTAALEADTEARKSSLLLMADGYDRKAREIEQDWKLRSKAAQPAE